MCSWALCQRWNLSTWANGSREVWQCCWLTGECVGGRYFCISNRNMLRLKIIRDVCGKYEIKGRKQEQSDMVKLSLRFSKDGGLCQMYSNRVPYVQHWWEFAIETRWKKGKGSAASQVALSVVLQTLQRKKMIFFFLHKHIKLHSNIISTNIHILHFVFCFLVHRIYFSLKVHFMLHNANEKYVCNT